MIKSFQLPLIFPAVTRPEAQVKVYPRLCFEFPKSRLGRFYHPGIEAESERIRRRRRLLQLLIKTRNPNGSVPQNFGLGLVYCDSKGLPILAYSEDLDRAWFEGTSYLINRTAEIDWRAPAAIVNFVKEIVHEDPMLKRCLNKVLSSHYKGDLAQIYLPWLAAYFGPGNHWVKTETRDLLGPTYHLELRRRGRKAYLRIVEWAAKLTRQDLINLCNYAALPN